MGVGFAALGAQRVNFMVPDFFKTVSLKRLTDRLEGDRLNLFTGLVLAIIASIATYYCAELIGPELFAIGPYGDTWFDSDVAAYYETIANHYDPTLHERTYKHPLLSLAFCLPIYLLQAFHLPPLIAVRLAVASIAAVWIASLFSFLRLMGCRLLEAVLISLLGMISAAGLFWLTVLESFGLGSIGLIWALSLVALAETRRLSWIWGVVISLATLSITVTNWVFGLVAVALAYARKQMIWVNGVALLIFAVLVGVQHKLFESALPLAIPAKELRYVVSAEAGSPWNVIQAFACHTVVMPAIQVIRHPRTGLPMMTVQFSAPGSGNGWGAIAVGLWLGLVALGLWQLFTLKTHGRLRLMIGISLLGQLGLHLVYTGRETFLYSLHFLPFWLGLVALGGLEVKHYLRRRLFTTLLIALLITVGINNLTQFAEARAFYHGAYPVDIEIEPNGA